MALAVALRSRLQAAAWSLAALIKWETLAATARNVLSACAPIHNPP